MASLSEMAAAKGKTVENNALASVKVQQIHYSKLHPSELNFYGQREVEEMADSIAMVGILQPLIVRKTDLSEYEVIVGHKRRLAVIMNVERGMKDCEFLPCIEIKASDKIVQEIKTLSNLTDKEAEDIYVRYVLMVTNSTQRELNDYERMMQAMEYKEIIPYMRGDAELKGRALRTEIAKEMKRSTGQIGTYESIYNNLIPEGMERFKNEEIGISVAAGLASLPEDVQRRLVDRQDLKIADIEKEKEKLSETVSESDTEKVPSDIVNTKCEGDFDSVSESDTEKVPQSLVNTKCEGSFETKSESSDPDRRMETCEENIQYAVALIFFNDNSNFPQWMMEELAGIINDYGTNTSVLTNALDKILPFENEYIELQRICGYKIGFKHTDRVINVPLWPFWIAFSTMYRERMQQEKTETVEAAVETCEESEVAAGDKEPIEPISEAHNYSSFVVKTYKHSGSLWHEEESIEKAFDKIRELIQKYDDIQQIHIVPKKAD